MSSRGEPGGTYRAMLRHPVAGRLVVARAVTEVGDFITLAALIVFTYGDSGSVLGPAAVLAARSLPALAVATLFSGWMDRPPRRAALVVLSLAGSAFVAVPAVFTNTLVAVVTVGLLGAVRAAYRSTHAAVIAEAVDGPLRLPLIGLSGSINQAVRVIGLLAGSSLTYWIGPRGALLIDAASYVVAAGVFATLPLAAKVVRGPRPPAREGMRIILSDPTMRVLAVVTWATFLSGGVPEAFAPRVAARPWVPAVMAASAFGGMVFMYLVGRRTFLDRPTNQMLTALGLGAAMVLGGLLLATGAPAWTIAVANAGAGAGAGWVIGAQATFAHLAPSGRMGQIEATMVATNILTEGAGILLLAALSTASPAVAYLVGGLIVIAAAGVAGQALRRRNVAR